MVEDNNAICNLILQHLKAKQMAEWTPEVVIEQALDGTVHYYHVRQALPALLKQKYVDFSKHGVSYKITAEGRKFINDGGYKIDSKI